jgi:hypothetical protein
MYTDSSSNLEEAHLRRHSTATYTYGGGSAYERSTLTAANVYTSEVDLQRLTPQLKHFLAWNETTVENHCTAEVHLQSTLTICFSTAITVMATLDEIQLH